MYIWLKFHIWKFILCWIAFLKNTDKNYRDNKYFKKEKILNQSVQVDNEQKENKNGSLINLMDNYEHNKDKDDDDDEHFLMSIEDFFKEQLKSSNKNKSSSTVKSTLVTDDTNKNKDRGI